MTRFNGVVPSAALTFVLLAAPAAGYGQALTSEATSTESVLSYGDDFFEIYNPITALDMIERLPGFTIDSGDTVRGFGGGAGNVLIDGARPSAKGQSLTDILRQIPADNVDRIDLIRGRAPGIDMRGQAVVANVIRKASKTSGFAELELRLSEGNRVTTNGTLSLTGEIAETAYTVGVRRFVFEDIDNQPETLLSPDRTALEFRPEKADLVPHQWTVTANLERGLGAWTLRSNNELFLNDFVFRELSPSFDVASGAFLRTNTTFVNDKTKRIEIGGDAERDLTDSGSLKIIALQTFRDFESNQIFDELRANGSTTRVFQTIDENAGESILRGVATFNPSASLTLEFGVEGAYNFLDSNVVLAIDEGAGPVPQNLPISNTKVEEYRAEPFANASWRPSKNLTLEAGLMTEISTLQQSGDAEETRSFVFFKPSFNVTYDASPRDQLRLGFRRDVAQLDFSDFVTSSTLNEQTTDFGNPDLEPQRDLVVSAEWERRFSENDSITLLVERKRLEAVQSLVPIAGQFDAPGNIGDGTLWRARMDWQFSLDDIGLDNAVFEGWYQYSDSKVRDPVTGEIRQLSFGAPGSDAPFRRHQVRVEFRQDFEKARWAWGWDYFFATPFEEFRLNERRRTAFGEKDLDAYIETSRFFGVKLRLEGGINEARILRERILFDGPRSDGVVRAIEVRDRAPEKQLLFTINKAF